MRVLPWLTPPVGVNLLSRMRPCASGSKEYLVRASYLEIYNEDIRDLLSKNPHAKLEMKENPEKGVYVKDLMQFVVKSREEITSVLEVGPGMQLRKACVCSCACAYVMHACVCTRALHVRMPCARLHVCV